MNRGAVVGLALLAILGGVGLGVLAAGPGGPAASSPANSGLVAVIGSTPPSLEPAPSGSSAPPSDAPGVAPSASPTPAPTPSLVPAPLDGRLVSPAAAIRHPIAVMIDDLFPARPQSGFSAASIVWQAPAEGGIPRYMMVFQETLPSLLGPVRSSRYYYIAWAAEWRAMYLHAGGSPQAMATLAAKGHGQYVYNAEDFRWEGRYLWRLRTRSSPHNVYTDGPNLLKLAKAIHAPDNATPPEPVWSFADDAPFRSRPIGGIIDTGYLANHIHYDYDRATNTYLRGVTREPKQTDAANGKRVAPKNVVIMLMHFGPLNDGHPNKKRLEADLIGKGPAWIATNGKTIKGTWRKDAITKPTRFFDAAGNPVTLTVGQTFIQVLQTGTRVTIKDGKAPPPPRTMEPL
jgi:hypothetical protein